MPKHVIETVTFRLLDGVNREDFAKAATDMNSCVESCIGFIARRLSCTQDGTWIEHIEWESIEAAKVAAAGIGEDPGNAAFLRTRDGSSANMMHSKLEVSATCCASRSFLPPMALSLTELGARSASAWQSSRTQQMRNFKPRRRGSWISPAAMPRTVDARRNPGALGYTRWSGLRKASGTCRFSAAPSENGGNLGSTICRYSTRHRSGSSALCRPPIGPDLDVLGSV